ncbi:MAG TPA: hypothetical protein VFE05_05215 [Longimicrobiaceae bacterium]|jgi:hypothetical protein|nr:hypothetical protein [Longimicrobiaceae bacterium]
MIRIALRSVLWRLPLLIPVVLWFYLKEPGFAFRGPIPAEFADDLKPSGLAFTLSNLAGLSLVILLGGFISHDRWRGYYKLYFAHPVRPVTFYAVRWLVGVAAAMGVAALFLVFGQLAAWGEMRVGPAFLLQPLLFTLVYGGILAFLSALIAWPWVDALLVVAIFYATEVWRFLIQDMGLELLTPGLRALVFLVLPPHYALNDIYTGLTMGVVDWAATLFTAGYALFWLALAALLVRFREWP